MLKSLGNTDVQSLLDSFSNKKIIVLGDVMVDAYILGSVNRISPEAPVPIVSFTKTEKRLGGAANVALNLTSLGADVQLFSVIGNDQEGNDLITLCKENKIDSNGLLQSDARKTTIKTRVIGNNQQLLRIDSEQTNDINNSDENALIERLERALQNGVDALIFEDYNKGVLSEKLIQKVISLTQQYNVITTVDPKKTNFFAYKGVTLFKPNLKELKEGLNLQFSIEDRSAFEQAVFELNAKITPLHTFITLSEHGVFIQHQQEKHYIPAHVRTIADVSGAGDTVISVATLCLTAGLNAEDIAEISNLAGGLVCEKPGVVSIDKDELLQELQLIYE